LKGQFFAMTGPEHSKKPKTVTIDLDATPVSEAATETVAEAFDALDDAPIPEAPEVVTAAPVVAKQSSGVIGKIGAGLVGGLIALIGGAGLQYSGQLPSFGGSTDIAALQAEVSKLASLPAVDPTVFEGLNRAQGELAAQITTLSAAVEQLKTTVSGAGSEAVAELQSKLTALESTVTQLPAGGAAGDPTASAAFQALAAKVAALEAAPAASGDAKSVATAIAASGLKAAIDRGGSFMNELETYASVVPASADVEALRGLAAKGVPSQQDLLAGFGDAASAMIAAATVPDPNIGILQRLTESAKGLVKARRVGDIEGDEPDAVVARMEVALQRGDLAGMLTLSEKLPEASKVAGKPYLDSVTARRDTDTLVTRALGAALTQAGGKS
jgi:hypothetical protein